MCALKESEIEKFQNRILKIDTDAFIIFSESSQIVGNGFRVYNARNTTGAELVVDGGNTIQLYPIISQA